METRGNKGKYEQIRVPKKQSMAYLRHRFTKYDRAGVYACETENRGFGASAGCQKRTGSLLLLVLFYHPADEGTRTIEIIRKSM